MKKGILIGGCAGFVAGILMWFVCAYIEHIANIELMTLLLNLDFIVNDASEVAKVTVHLIISIMIGIVTGLIYHRMHSLYLPYAVISVIGLSMLFFVLHYLSVQDIQTGGRIGFLLWVILHIGYFELLHFILVKLK